MYIIKNAIKSIIRTPVRNIFIGIIVIVIGMCSCISLSIKSAANEIVDSAIENAEIVASFNIDRKSMQSLVRQGKMDKLKLGGISSEKILEYADSKQVKEARIVSTIGMNSSNIEKVESDSFIDKHSSKVNNKTGMVRVPGKQSGKLNLADFSITSYNTNSAMKEFVSKQYQILEGELIDATSKEYICIINSELAAENELKLGSKIKLVNPENEADEYTFEVVGTYLDNEASTDMLSMFSNSVNKIIIPEKTLNDIANKSDLTKSINSTLILNGIDSIEPFKKEVEAKGLEEGYIIETNEEKAMAAVKPIRNLIKFSNTFLIVVLGIGVVVLTILSAINVRERKYEIGVLRAIGMRKRLVIFQFMTETIMVTVIAMIIGTTIGALASVPVSNQMLASEIESQSAELENKTSSYGMRPNKIPKKAEEVSYIANIEASINIKVVAELFLIAIVIAFVTSGLSVLAIVMYNPLDILSSRS